MSIGIYKITNPKGKVYIGKSKDIEKRFKSYYKIWHCSQQIKLFNSLKKYLPENHTFEIIEECDIKQLNKREIYYINSFNSLNSGLNLTIGGDGGTITKESAMLRGLKIRKPILQYDLKGNFIREFSGAIEAIKFLGRGNSNNINDCARGKYISTYGYIWLYKYGEVKLNITPRLSNQGCHNMWGNERREKIKQSRMNEKRSKEFCNKMSNLKKKKIYQYDIDNKLNNIFPSFDSFDGCGVIGTTKLRKILNKDIYYRGYKYTNIELNND
jgi:hypothetical protein